MGRQPYDLKKTDPSQGFLSHEDYQSFIPVSERYNFNGDIQLSSTLKFSSEDVAKIAKFLDEQFGYRLVHVDRYLSIDKFIKYKDSKFEKTSNTWDLLPTVRKKKGRSDFVFGRHGKDHEWQQLVRFVADMIPTVLYFKNEVFDFPDRIYISRTEEKRKGGPTGSVNKFYCEVIQDILFSIDPALRLDTHITARRRSNTASDRQVLAGLLQKIGREVTNTVMRQWETIFARPLKDKRIQAICEMDPNGQVYLQLRLEDGGELFDIKERSTGFRWFFVFILLTQYRGHRNESAIFLYDEPASNLHSAAQQQLLDCFANLPEQFTVLYSTHSHYLINPDWLDSTMVVRNEAAVSDDDIVNSDTAKTDIKLLHYRKFVSDYPSGLSYFQPILDVLGYLPSKLEGVKPAVLVEGKGDFYTLSYLSKVCLNLELPYDFIPCLGSGTLDQLIALYGGWGKDFLVLLDSDTAGRSEKARYEKKFGSLVHELIICYGDINPEWEKASLEKVLGKTELLALQEHVFPSTPYKKDRIHLAIQELHAKKQRVSLSSDLEETIKRIVSFLQLKLEGLI